MNQTDFYQIADELGIANERIQNIDYKPDLVFFSVNGANFGAKLTKSGKYKKGSVRRV